jgi:hypothetical protein
VHAVRVKLGVLGLGQRGVDGLQLCGGVRPDEETARDKGLSLVTLTALPRRPIPSLRRWWSGRWWG